VNADGVLPALTLVHDLELQSAGPMREAFASAAPSKLPSG